ncbi:uncharacterized protein PAC_17114 [Phialocephala subalpina]|uniref:2EXR domain-containing protein n=1 Tax=Phialocephala subalpina TaxID=576137 RepID=A0A1L7XQC5_9HELO|nr:uncharacterized protein PAC_17114 [Phialocephala subalpina]
MSDVQNASRSASSSAVIAGRPSIPTTFKSFQKLPIELRLIIWNLALPGPRVVEIEWSKRTDSRFCPTDSSYTPCAFFQACKESRESTAGSPLPSSRKRKRGREPPNEEDPPSPSEVRYLSQACSKHMLTLCPGRGKQASTKKIKAAKKTSA